MSEKENLINQLTISLGDLWGGSLSQLQGLISDSLKNYTITKMDCTLPSIGDGSMTKELLKRFAEEKICKGNKRGSIQQTINAILNLCNYCNREANMIDSADIKNWLNYRRIQLGNSGTTMNNYFRWVSSFYTFLFNHKYISDNPIINVPSPKRNTTHEEPLSDKERAILRVACENGKNGYENARRMAMINFMLDSGVRVSELCSIQYNDINFDTKSLKVIGKGDKERTVYFGDETLIRLQEYFRYRNDLVTTQNGANPYLFCSLDSSHHKLEPSAIRSELNKLSKVTGIDRLHPHLLRSTFATRLVEHGTPIEVVSELLGHSKLDTTMIYVRTSAEYKKSAIKS